MCILNYSFAKCKFGSPEELEGCATLFYDEAVQFCATQDIMPPGMQVSMSDVALREHIHSARWDEIKNPQWEKMMDEAISTGWTGEHTRMVLKPRNLGSVMIYLGMLWLFLGIFLALPMCCCCMGSMRCRKPANLLLIVILTIALTISGMILVSKTGQKSLQLEDGVNRIQCLMPRSIYSLGFMRTEDIGPADAHFEGIVNLGHLMKSMVDTGLSIIRDGPKFVKEDALLSMMSVPYSPLIWTNYLLSKQNYDSWLWAPNGTRKQDTTLRHLSLGYSMLSKLVDWDSISDKSDWYQLRNSIKIINRKLPTIDVKEYEKEVEEFNLTAKKVYIDIQPIFNLDTKKFLASSIWWYSKKGAIIASFLPIAGIIGGFSLFVFYMMKSDNAFRTRNASSRRLWATRIMSFGYSVYGISILILAGALFVLLIMFRGTCDVAKRDLKTGEHIRKWIPSDLVADVIIQECALEEGKGSLLNALNLRKYMERPIGIFNFEFPSEILQVYRPPTLDDKLTKGLIDQPLDLVLVDFEALGYSESTLTGPSIYWSGLQEDDVTIDCSDNRFEQTCTALKNIKELNVHIPSEFTEFYKIYGLFSVSRELNRIISKSSCKNFTVCVAGDYRCPKGAVVIGPDTIGPPPNDIQKTTVWETIANTMSRTRIAKALFKCFNDSTREVQEEWLHATYYATLKAIALHGARRTTSPIGIQQDNCPIGRRCTPFHHLNFLDKNRNLDDTLVPYAVFKENINKDIKSANIIYSNTTQIFDVITEAGKFYNPIKRETSEDFY